MIDQPTQENSTYPSDLDTPLTPQFIEAFASDTLIIDCIRITLKQNSDFNLKVIEGMGLISLQGGKQFQLRMFTQSPMDDAITFNFAKFKSWIPGTIIPVEDYYSLEAVDVSGHSWRNDQILIDVHGVNEGRVITAKFSRLTSDWRSLSALPTSGLNLFFFQELDIPYNRSVASERKIGDQILSSSLAHEIAEIDIDDLTFKFMKTPSEKGSTLLSVRSKTGQFPSALQERIEETLRYVTFSPISACIIEQIFEGHREISITPRQNYKRGLFDTPMDADVHQGSDYWRLFSAYFRHVISYPEKEFYHPLTAQLHRVISSQSKQLDLAGLLVSIAVEGILTTQLEKLAEPSVLFKANVDSVINLVKRIKCTDDSLAKRLNGMLPHLKSSRAKDKLKFLRDKNLITKDMYDDWKSLRNASAHGSIRAGAIDFQILWNKCNTVYTLLNLLVFLSIGYSGKYRDFSTIGWPIKNFEGHTNS